MKYSRILTLIILGLTTLMFDCQHQKTISVSFPENSSIVIENTASELVKYLGKIYPDIKFIITSDFEKNNSILIGTKEQLKTSYPLFEELNTPESYWIINDSNSGVIAGADEKGVLNGVYALLERLGCDFYLSFETLPNEKKQFSFKEWDLKDEPLTKDKIIFNWHNFISGCTGWDLGDWQKWIEQSAKMRYNTIMVHAYGNNPMFGFEYNGKVKEIGYLTTTASGRDWGAEHVNDIRNLLGGEIFSEPVFGSSAAKVEDNNRIKAATELMQQTFKHAATFGMKICLAFDIDTWMANPRNIIETLPQDVILKINEFIVANPDHPTGYKYYKALLKSQLDTYPEITQVALWCRSPSKWSNSFAPWRAIRPNQFPKEWKTEYFEILKKHPGIKENFVASGTFAIGKIIAAFQKANKELGNPVEIVSGSWDFNFMETAHIFYPPDIPLVPLDYDVKLDQSEVINFINSISNEREIIPVVWAHHDDRHYIGRPYKPFENYSTLLKKTNSRGFGIIHWMTHPLDIYFKNTIRQIWSSSKNEEQAVTSKMMANSVFNLNNEILNSYLLEWNSNGPMFGRETGDNFMDIGRPLKEEIYNAETNIKNAESRLELLSEIDSSELSKNGLKHYRYFKGMEEFTISFFQNHINFNKAYQLIQVGEFEKAKSLAQQTNPRDVVKKYADFSSKLEFTKGEQAILISMNLRWLPDYIDLYQQLRMENIRINFQPTKHDPLAQSPGKYSFFIDNENNFWLGLGEKELTSGKAESKVFPVENMQTSFVRFYKPEAIPLKTMRGNPIYKGKYDIKIFFPDQHNDSSFEFQLLEGNKKLIAKNIHPETNSNQLIQIPFETTGKDISVKFYPKNERGIAVAGIEIIPIQ